MTATDVQELWENINPPLQSYFAGFDPPSDGRKWHQALNQASLGQQILLANVLEAVRSPFDLHEGDYEFKWVHTMVDYHLARGTARRKKWRNDLRFYPRGRKDKAPIVMLGYHIFNISGWTVPVDRKLN